VKDRDFIDITEKNVRIQTEVVEKLKEIKRELGKIDDRLEMIEKGLNRMELETKSIKDWLFRIIIPIILALIAIILTVIGVPLDILKGF